MNSIFILDFSDKKLKENVNADLADTLGNLLQRSTNLKLNMKQCFPSLYNQLNDDQLDNDLLDNEKLSNLTDDLLANELIQQLTDLTEKVFVNYENGNFYLGINEVMIVLRKCNKFFFDQEPWKLVKNLTNENNKKLNLTLYLTYETLRISSILLNPIIPNCTETIFKKLNVPSDKRSWKDCKLKIYHPNEELRKFSEDKLIVYQKILN